MFDYLVKRGIDILQPDNFEKTLLDERQPNHSVPLNELTKHIPLDFPDQNRQRTRQAAVLKKEYDQVQKLTEAGSDPACMDVNGISPLHLANG